MVVSLTGEVSGGAVWALLTPILSFLCSVIPWPLPLNELSARF